MNYDGILFDLDGTLWNATNSIAVAWQIALADAPDVPRCPSVKELEGVMGMTAEELVETLFPYLSPERGMQLFDRCCDVENEYLREHGGVLYEGVEELLRTLSKQVPLAIVSNCNARYIPCFLDAHKLHDCFSDWECIGRTGLQKWENIRLVAERGRMSAPVYIGDTAMDQASAEKAGVPFIHAAYGFGQAPGAEKIDRPLDLLALLNK